MSALGVRREPCSSCPYRCDAPSGLWAAEEYQKLPLYDAATMAQPPFGFRCHATPDWFCSGWAHVHGWDLLALRLAAVDGVPIDLEPNISVELFGSGWEACEHGLAEVERPSADALEVASRLLRKYPRLTT